MLSHWHDGLLSSQMHLGTTKCVIQIRCALSLAQEIIEPHYVLDTTVTRKSHPVNKWITKCALSVATNIPPCRRFGARGDVERSFGDVRTTL